MADLWTHHEPNIEEEPNDTNSEKNSIFGEEQPEPIVTDDPEITTSFYGEQYPAERVAQQPFQPLNLESFQFPPSIKLPLNPIPPTYVSAMSQYAPALQTQVAATMEKTKEYGMNKP